MVVIVSGSLMREAWQLLNEKLANAVTGSPLYSGGMLISSSLQVPTPFTQ